MYSTYGPRVHGALDIMSSMMHEEDKHPFMICRYIDESARLFVRPTPSIGLVLCTVYEARRKRSARKRVLNGTTEVRGCTYKPTRGNAMEGYICEFVTRLL